MPSATMTSKGQITIPKVIREQLDLQAGDEVQFNLREDRVVEMTARTRDLRELCGLIRPGRNAVPLTVAEIDEAIADAVRSEHCRSSR